LTTGPGDFTAYLGELKKNAKGDGGTAWDQIRQRQAMITHDIPAEFGITLEQAAQRVRAQLLAINTPQDLMVNPIPAQKFAQAMGATIVTVDSTCGHRSFRCVSIGPIVAQFLANPAAVHSTTIQDPANY
jgi:hypothetical protein